ncbi:MAG: anthranilate synthase component I family protein [Phycisphaerales bacterium]|nr:anthranilate synthase component I family protein [Planctomycetota bacterium]MBL6997106.1 anthranilate synthase component I family protein [Phycisphaerales bacterium]
MLPKDAKHLPNLTATPAQVAASWTSSQPIIALIGNGNHSRWSRWSIIAPADGERLTIEDNHNLEDLWLRLQDKSNESILPNWIGYIGYEFGYCIEPKSGSRQSGKWPLVDLIWCDRALVHDAKSDSWWSIGGCEAPRVSPLQTAKSSWGELQDSTGSEVFKSAVERSVEYILAGDIFQANITRRFAADVCGDIRSSALSMLSNPGGWYGAWIEYPEEGRYLMSMSPELFLQFDGESREIITRPMKGTRPETDNPEQLLDSEKDAAELHMIVDLMRNDLGRICDFGSIEVLHARSIEQHPTVWQCVGEIHGKVRADVGIEDLLRATFPAGSITGAPKIRAMQIIRELESTPRGPYCGAIGVLGKSLMLNVAIRTAMFTGIGPSHAFKGDLEYSTGCGIVADSDPDAELLESEIKTHILQPCDL